MKTYYFDNNATTPVSERVWQTMEPFLKSEYGNPSSLHHRGRAPAKALREARIQVAQLLGAADDREILFTSCGSESNNTAILSCLSTNPSKKQFVTSSVEHSSIRKLGRNLSGQGYDVVEVGVSTQGFLLMDELKRVISDQTAVVSLMLANNETGALFPIDEIGSLLRERGILFHVDAVQAVGKYSLNVKSSPIDFLSLSAHKLYGPKGVGALYVRQGVPFKSFVVGGGQERGRRAGTENVAGIAGLGAACELALSDLPQEIDRLKKLRALFEDSLGEKVPGIEINGDLYRRLPTTRNVRFPGVDAEALMMALDQKGICVSSGSACMSGSHEPSHVLKAMGLSDEEANSSIRFSFGRFTSEQDIREVVPMIRETLDYFKEVERNSVAGSRKAPR